MVSKYLDVLKSLHIIKEEIPVTASRKFKKRLYLISDPYFNFWFRYVYPNKIDLEAGRSEEITALIKNDFSDYAGHMFEVLVEDLIRTKYALNQFSFSEIGRWWHDGEEIDIIALNDASKDIVFVECKWQNLSHKDAKQVLFDLQEKSKHVEWNPGKRKEHFAVFAKKIEGKEHLRKKGFIIWDFEDY